MVTAFESRYGTPPGVGQTVNTGMVTLLNQDKVHHRVSVKLLILVWLLSLNKDNVHHRVSVNRTVSTGMVTLFESR